MNHHLNFRILSKQRQQKFWKLHFSSWIYVFLFSCFVLIVKSMYRRLIDSVKTNFELYSYNLRKIKVFGNRSTHSEFIHVLTCFRWFWSRWSSFIIIKIWIWSVQWLSNHLENKIFKNWMKMDTFQERIDGFWCSHESEVRLANSNWWIQYSCGKNIHKYPDSDWNRYLLEFFCSLITNLRSDF